MNCQWRTIAILATVVAVSCRESQAAPPVKSPGWHSKIEIRNRDLPWEHVLAMVLTIVVVAYGSDRLGNWMQRRRSGQMGMLFAGLSGAALAGVVVGAWLWALSVLQISPSGLYVEATFLIGFAALTAGRNRKDAEKKSNQNAGTG